MTLYRAQNLAASCVCLAVLAYFAYTGLSTSAVVCAAVAACFILVYGLIAKKQQGIVEKIDVYALLTVLGVLAIRAEQLYYSFTLSYFSNGDIYNPALIVLALICGPAAGIIINGAGKKKKTPLAKTAFKYTGLFVAATGVSVYLMGRAYLPVLLQHAFIFTISAAVAVCRSNMKGKRASEGRLSFISFLIALMIPVLRVFFPRFRLLKVGFAEFLSTEVLPWYNVLVLSLLGLVILGMLVKNKAGVPCEDSMFIAGMTGLVWVIKASLSFYFTLSWISVCVYVLVFFILLNRFTKRGTRDAKAPLSLILLGSDTLHVVVAALAVLASVFLMHTGYVHFWLSLALGIPLIIHAKKIASGWLRDAVFWQCVLLTAAAGACTLALQYGYSASKITAIAAMFAFASIVMWMLNYRNNVGVNKFRKTKAAVTLMFCALVLITALRAGTRISAQPADSPDGAFPISDTSGLTVSAKPAGKDGGAGKISYAWAESFWYDEDSVKPLSGGAGLKIENAHLILWAENGYGVISRRDYWFKTGY